MLKTRHTNIFPSHNYICNQTFDTALSEEEDVNLYIFANVLANDLFQLGKILIDYESWSLNIQAEKIRNFLTTSDDDIFFGIDHLDLSNQNLTELPDEIGKLTNLKRLYLWDNRLTKLPKEIGDLSNLLELYLGNNKLTKLPPEIGNLTNLQWLDITNNQLTKLPHEIKNLTNLSGLILDNNNLTEYPTTNLLNLIKLSVLNNPLKANVL